MIEQAFKIQKFKDVCGKNPIYPNINQINPYQVYQQQSYFNYQQPYYQNYGDENMSINYGRRGMGLSNLV